MREVRNDPGGTGGEGEVRRAWGHACAGSLAGKDPRSSACQHSLVNGGTVVGAAKRSIDGHPANRLDDDGEDSDVGFDRHNWFFRALRPVLSSLLHLDFLDHQSTPRFSLSFSCQAVGMSPTSLAPLSSVVDWQLPCAQLKGDTERARHRHTCL